MTVTIGRRELLVALGGAAAAWPLTARAQQRATPVIGFLNSQSPDAIVNRVRGFRRGLKDAGYVEGENVTIEYRWAEGRFDRLPALAAELVRRQVVVIVAANTASALAAKAVTTTIPIVFNVAEDPVKLGLVASLARPGGNLTGANSFIGELSAKRLELLRELLPGVTRVTALVNPTTPLAESALKDIEPAARTMGMEIKVLTPAAAARSMQLSQLSCTNGPTRCSLAPIAYSQLGVFNWSIWRRATQSQPRILRVSFLKSAA